jgi:hypothetical protein
MKKLFAILALVGVMTSCKSKKKDEKKTEDTTMTDTSGVNTNNTSTTTPTTTDNSTTTTTTGEIPKFADPEVQKFVDEYSALLLDWKNHPNDVALAQKWSTKSMEWNTTMTNMAARIMKDPTGPEAQKWAEWSKWIAAKMQMNPPK